MNSLFTGILCFILALAVLSIAPIGSKELIMLSFMIGVSLFGGMLISALARILIPLTLDKLKIDPAAALGPIISTINDFFALIIYFGIATIMFIS